MIYFVSVFSFLFAVNIILYIVSIIKNISTMENISKACILPFISGIALSLLSNRIPDSIHTMILVSASLLLIITAEIFFLFENNQKMIIAARLFVILHLGIWVELFRTIFFIYKIPVLFNILGAVISLTIYIVLFIFSGKKQSFLFYILLFVYCTELSALNYTAFITVCTTLKLYSFILLAGTLTLTASCGLYILQNTKPRIQSQKKYGVLRTILINSAELLICTATVLMIN